MFKVRKSQGYLQKLVWLIVADPASNQQDYRTLHWAQQRVCNGVDYFYYAKLFRRSLEIQLIQSFFSIFTAFQLGVSNLWLSQRLPKGAGLKIEVSKSLFPGGDIIIFTQLLYISFKQFKQGFFVYMFVGFFLSFEFSDLKDIPHYKIILLCAKTLTK